GDTTGGERCRSAVELAFRRANTGARARQPGVREALETVRAEEVIWQNIQYDKFSLHTYAPSSNPPSFPQVLSEPEKTEVHRHVLEMMKSVAVTEANSGVLNLKTTRRHYNNSHNAGGDTNNAHEAHPFREYMDNPAPDTSVSDSEEIMAYVNMKVHLDDDDILGWWSGTSASGLSTLRLLARKILAVPATCAYAHDLCVDARQAARKWALR
ncbi:uncharacterized protein LOC119572119, partial [Penaeus monodon]|uniref:uncharacterized protein LOC119572119 n=1 Tax=Penaeus monodon TaxID=6687 RepID=UPI0018A76FC0